MEKILAYLSDEKKASELFLQTRWEAGQVLCPYCGSQNVIRKGTYHNYYKRYSCKDCRKKEGKYVTFTDKTGTIFDGSQLTMRNWAQINFLISLKQTKKEIAHTMEMNYQRILRATRLIQASVYEQQCKEKESKPLEAEHIEVDEMYITAGLKGNADAVKRAGRKPRKRRLKKEVGERIILTRCL